MTGDVSEWILTSVSTSAEQKPAPRKPVARKRVPAQERREEVLAAAAEVIAVDGMNGASTAAIAKKSGISHAYLFRLFPTKEELLCAVARENGRVINQRMIGEGEAAKARGEDVLAAMGAAWIELLRDRTLLQVNLHGISASKSLDSVGAVMREQWEKMVVDIERVSGATPDEARAFVAEGTLLLVISGLGAEESTWATRLHDGPLPCAPDKLSFTSTPPDGPAPAPSTAAPAQPTLTNPSPDSPKA